MRSAVRLGLALLVSVLVAVPLSGCAGSGDQPREAGSDVGATEPTFTGPFADEYTEAWRSTDADLVRNIIADEVVTDQEWSEVLTSLTQCLEDKGITIDEYNDDGSYFADVGEQEGDSVNEGMGECEKETGEAWIGWLYRAQTDNPDNVPESELLTECLIRNGAVSSTYTVEEYLEDAPQLEFPFIDEHGYETFEKCSADPALVP